MAHNHSFVIKSQKRLIITIFLNLIITAAEIVGGLFSGSLALLSDAFHNFTDASSIVISFIALKISQKDKTLKCTFGYKRAEILAALLNASLLVIISFFIVKESVSRLLEPEKIKTSIMISVAAIGLIGNILSVLLLKTFKGKSINIKSAYLHLMSDTLSSVAVIIGGIVIYFFNIYWLDPILSFLIVAYILKECYEILREVINILMQNVPNNIEILKVKDRLEKIKEVKDVHHIHIWLLNDREVHFEGHIKIDKDIKVSQTDKIRAKVERILKRDFNISHITLQVEYKCL